MAKKKTGLGVDALFGPAADEQEPQAQDTDEQAKGEKPSQEQAAPPAKDKPGAPESPDDHGADEVAPAAPQSPAQIKVSALLYPGDYDLLTEIQLKWRRRVRGGKVSQSEIIREALRRFAEQEGIPPRDE